MCPQVARQTTTCQIECRGPNCSAQSIEQWLGLLEQFVVLLYDRTSSQECVNDARKQLFTQKGRAIDSLPPTQAALIQHIKRAAYQAGHCWAQMMIAAPELPSPSEWGWNKRVEGGWEVCWTTLPEATQACRELIRCGFKKGTANARRLLCSALLFVSAVDFALTDHFYDPLNNDIWHCLPL